MQASHYIKDFITTREEAKNKNCNIDGIDYIERHNSVGQYSLKTF
jgi:hypothetical protein